ncbi:MAG: shikimate dehydrogenase [Actinomycetales bacterium]
MPAAGVMGSPIAHSLSPALHLAAYRSLGLPWTYVAREVDEAALPEALAGLGPDWVGVSLTMPLKQAVLPLLDEVSDLARDVGAVNTVTFGPGAWRSGDNTDVYGITAALRAAGVEDGRGAVVLGGGATAASAVAALRELGEQTATLVVRSRERARGVEAAAERLGVRVRLASWDQAGPLAACAPVVVSTVPPGAADRIRLNVSTAGVLLDVVYRPWPTALAGAWQRAGGVAVPGLEMLVHQAAAQVRAWTGEWPDLQQMMRAAQAQTA